MLNPGLAPDPQGLAKTCGMPFEDGEAGTIKLYSLISAVIICSLQTSETPLHPSPAPSSCGSFQEPETPLSSPKLHVGIPGGVNSCPLPRFISPGGPHVPQKLLCHVAVLPGDKSQGGIQPGRGEHPPGMPALGSWATEAQQKAQFSLEIMELQNGLGWEGT